MCCHCLSRREFMGAAGVMFAAGMSAGSIANAAVSGNAAWNTDLWNPDRPLQLSGKALVVQPILMYHLPQRKEMTSWKAWGDIRTPEAVKEEVLRITRELNDLAQRAEFGLEFRPVAEVTSEEEAVKASCCDSDLVIVYPANGWGDMLRACTPKDRSLIFVRHRSGPLYYWYESLSARYLRTGKDADDAEKALSVDDVVVDDTDELLWRLRAFYAVKNFRATRVLALGGAYGKYAENAPQVAQEKLGLTIETCSYDDFAPRVEKALADKALMNLAETWTDTYLNIPGTKPATERSFIVNSFILYGLFKELMQEHNASVFTINQCMGTIMPMAKTTACLTLSLMNDEGIPAFCESDFVIIPAGILLHHVTCKPVFQHNSSFPHKGIMTCAHCTSPRRMDGRRYEPTLLTTHYESEYGVAPKVDMPIGQELTFIDPEYDTCRWLGIRGTVEANPSLEICRSQQDVRIHGDWKRLCKEARDSHWVMAYGDYLKECGYAAQRIGVTWDPISEES